MSIATSVAASTAASATLAAVLPAKRAAPARPALARLAPSRLAPALAGKDLIRRIIDFAHTHALQAGERFPAERNLAQTLGVSRNALREALATLESLRVVELRPNSGVYLRALASESSFEATVLLAELGNAPGAAEVRETIEVRAALERQAIALACARRTPDDLARLTRISLDTGAVIAAKGNIVECDQAFHLALANASHNSVLVRMLNAFYCLTLERRRVYFANPKRGLASCDQHNQLIAAIEKRDVARAVKLIDAHLSNAQVYWKEALNVPMPASRNAARSSTRSARQGLNTGANRTPSIEV